MFVLLDSGIIQLMSTVPPVTINVILVVQVQINVILVIVILIEVYLRIANVNKDILMILTLIVLSVLINV